MTEEEERNTIMELKDEIKKLNIRFLMQKMTSAKNDIEREVIINEIESKFLSLTDEERQDVRKDFFEDLYEKIGEGKKLLSRIDMCINERILEPA